MPVFTIELGSSQELVFPKDFFTSSDLEMEILEKDGKEYLNLKEPVSIPFTVSLKPGVAVIGSKAGSNILDALSKKAGALKKKPNSRLPFIPPTAFIKKNS